MTIKEVEEQTGLTRSNIRFYEKEKLIEPSRNDKNGYRDYSEKDLENIKKIAYLRTLEFSVEDIRYIINEKVSLVEILKKQNERLQEQIEGLNKAKLMCERMLEAGDVSFEELQIEKYVADLSDYWIDNQTVFKLDSVSFLYIWGSFVTWAIIASLCLIIGIMSYAKLPPEIPVQWSEGIAISLVDKKFIFAYPIACIVIRMLLRPILYSKLASRELLSTHHISGELITEYLSNYICFIALSAEVFSILFVYGLVKSILVVLAVDTAVLIGMLAGGITKMGILGKRIV